MQLLAARKQPNNCSRQALKNRKNRSQPMIQMVLNNSCHYSNVELPNRRISKHNEEVHESFSSVKSRDHDRASMQCQGDIDAAAGALAGISRARACSTGAIARATSGMQ